MLLPKRYSTCKMYSYKIYRYILDSRCNIFICIYTLFYVINDFADYSKKYSVIQQMNISHFVKL